MLRIKAFFKWITANMWVVVAVMIFIAGMILGSKRSGQEAMKKAKEDVKKADDNLKSAQAEHKASVAETKATIAKAKEEKKKRKATVSDMIKPKGDG